MVGKWHLGHNEGFHPTYRGFRTYTGLPYSGDMGCIDIVPKGCGMPDGDAPGSPACPGMCPPDGPPESNATTAAASGADPVTAIPLYGSSDAWAGTNCSGRPCSEEIILAPFNPNDLNTHYVARSTEIVQRYVNNCVSCAMLGEWDVRPGGTARPQPPGTEPLPSPRGAGGRPGGLRTALPIVLTSAFLTLTLFQVRQGRRDGGDSVLPLRRLCPHPHPHGLRAAMGRRLDALSAADPLVQHLRQHPRGG